MLSIVVKTYFVGNVLVALLHEQKSTILLQLRRPTGLKPIFPSECTNFKVAIESSQTFLLIPVGLFSSPSLNSWERELVKDFTILERHVK